MFKVSIGDNVYRELKVLYFDSSRKRHVLSLNTYTLNGAFRSYDVMNSELNASLELEVIKRKNTKRLNQLNDELEKIADKVFDHWQANGLKSAAFYAKTQLGFQ